jgi:N-acetylglucosamine kinase-like BadF-type ATPase
VGLVIGVDGGNTKTELAAATVDGDVLARVAGQGSNSHAVGEEAVGRIVSELHARAGLDGPADHGVFYLCGADVPEDIEALRAAVVAADVARNVVVDNDTFALLRAGTDRADAVAVVCGGGINSVGRRADGRVARYPALGWETGDWGGAGMLGREALFLAARAEDGRGEWTVLVERICAHFGARSVEAVGADVHYRRLPAARLGELAPVVLDAAAAGDPIGSGLVDRVAEEVAALACKALRDLELHEADVVLGGGMLHEGGILVERVRPLLPAGVQVVVLDAPPVLGAVLAALDAAGASDEAKQRVRGGLRVG